MALIRKLKSLLGLDSAESESRDVGVTVEHEPPTEGDADPSTEIETAEVDAASSDEPTDDEFKSADDATDETVGVEDADVDEAEAIGDVDAPTREEEPVDAAVSTESEEPVDAGASTEDEAPVDADAPTEDDDPEASTTESGEPVDVIKGIGPTYAERLGAAGVESVGELADADAATLGEEIDVSETRVQKWIDQAKHR